jgi:hypothetical protein
MAMNFHATGGMSPSTPNRFIATLTPADRALLEPSLKIITLEQGKILYEQGGDINQVYFPHNGMISVVALLDQGDKIVEVATIGREAEPLPPEPQAENQRSEDSQTHCETRRF